MAPERWKAENFAGRAYPRLRGQSGARQGAGLRITEAPGADAALRRRFGRDPAIAYGSVVTRAD